MLRTQPLAAVAGMRPPLRLPATRVFARVPTRVWVLLGIALILRVAVVSATLFTPTTLDPADFSGDGVAISQGHWPQSNRAPGGGPSAYRPPAYPLFLGAVYWAAGQEAPPAARMVQVLLGVLSVALIGMIATRLWGRRIGVMALGIAAVAPPLVIFSTTLISEALFVPVILGAIAATLRAGDSRHPLRWVAFVGLLLGIAELTRTNAIVLLPPLGYALWRAGRGQPRAWLRPVLATVVCVLTIAPWTLRNWLVLHSFIPVSTEIGYTLAGTYNQASRADTHWPAVWKEAEHGASPEYGEILFTADINRWGEVRFGDRLLSAAMADIKRDPAYMLKVVWWNAVRMFHLGELDFGIANLRDTDIPKVPAWMEVIGFYLLGALAVIGAILSIAARPRAGVRRCPLWLWVCPVLLCSTLLVTGFIRFRAGVDPFLVFLAALGIAGAADRLRGLRGRLGSTRARARVAT